MLLLIKCYRGVIMMADIDVVLFVPFQSESLRAPPD